MQTTEETKKEVKPEERLNELEQWLSEHGFTGHHNGVWENKVFRLSVMNKSDHVFTPSGYMSFPTKEWTVSRMENALFLTRSSTYPNLTDLQVIRFVESAIKDTQEYLTQMGDQIKKGY